ncbi:ribosome maturation factor RimP [Numidum massiliense]|uniref:ribosome maturation factor RimP n=1 Tax=Numidum massiliense TaxID=1522315 RepID=UPI0006D59F24|nr:ribosome maturation factor RimP [Numidum massiliense]
MSRKITEIVEQLASPIAEQEQLELVDIEYKKEGSNWFLRVFVDKPGGVDIADCERVSEALSQQLDEKDPIQGPYFLEVSSPGAERPLKNERDYLHAVGKHVHVTTYAPVDGQKVFEGKLHAYDDEILVIASGGKQWNVPLNQVANARLAIVF